jgi:hypothetical protein
MNLRELAEQDLQKTLEDNINGFACNIEIFNSANSSQILKGSYFRISVGIDPDTGLKIKSKQSSVVVRTTSLRIILKKDLKVTATDIKGELFTGFISEITPDDTLGYTSIYLREANNNV